MKEKQIKVAYLLDRNHPQLWKGSLKDAMLIALAEIHEHAGASSPAYAFTNAIFGEFKKGIWS